LLDGCIVVDSFGCTVLYPIKIHLYPRPSPLFTCCPIISNTYSILKFLSQQTSTYLRYNYCAWYANLSRQPHQDASFQEMDSVWKPVWKSWICNIVKAKSNRFQIQNKIRHARPLDYLSFHNLCNPALIKSFIRS
jgi:hypothetical protein